MDKVFSENMGLIQDLHAPFNLNTAVNKATTKIITSINTCVTTALADLKYEYHTLVTKLSNNTTLEDKRDNILAGIKNRKLNATQNITDDTSRTNINTNKILSSLQDHKKMPLSTSTL